MARGLTWSPEAIEDIESIAAYIERDSAWYAKAVASRIVETAETIPDSRSFKWAGLRRFREH
jgi:plasmid stabilization system protein ParE